MAKELILTGSVQGVACRAYCKQYARVFRIRGSASNKSDGSVQVLLDTDNESLVKEYAHALKYNPRGFSFWGNIKHIGMRDYDQPIRGGDYVF